MCQRDFSTLPITFDGLSPRMKQIARALTAPILRHEEWKSWIRAILGKYDDEARIERFLEPEWLVAEAPMVVCHEGMGSGSFGSEILVGDVANEVNQNLRDRHEDLKLSAKKVGMVVRGLGLPTTRLGRSGRGLTLTDGVKQKIHEVAAQLGIDRRTLATMMALRIDYGGARCVLCEEFGLGAGLSFADQDLFPEKKWRDIINSNFFCVMCGKEDC